MGVMISSLSNSNEWPHTKISVMGAGDLVCWRTRRDFAPLSRGYSRSANESVDVCLGCHIK